MVSQWGELLINDIRGLEFVNITDRFLRFRGTQVKVQEGLRRIEYRPAQGAYKLKDQIEVSCAWTRWEAMRRPNRQTSAVLIDMHIEIPDPPLYFTLERKHFVVNEDEALRVRVLPGDSVRYLAKILEIGKMDSVHSLLGFAVGALSNFGTQTQ